MRDGKIVVEKSGDRLGCPCCGKRYVFRRGLANHIADKHGFVKVTEDDILIRGIDFDREDQRKSA